MIRGWPTSPNGSAPFPDRGGSIRRFCGPQPRFEVCDPFHESANTPYGWTVACGSMAASPALARWIGSRPVMWLAYGSLPLHWLVWDWLLTPTDWCT